MLNETARTSSGASGLASVTSIDVLEKTTPNFLAAIVGVVLSAPDLKLSEAC